jgi:hypothetical protein
MMLTRRSLALGSAAVAASAIAVGPEALAAPRRRRLGQSAENGQAVLDWQRISFRTVYADQTPVTPIPVGVPVLGFVSLAMHRAAQRSAHLGASSESAAVSRAAHDVLAHYFPGTGAKLAADLATTYTAIGPGQARTKGGRIGANAARQVLDSRTGDGWMDPSVRYSRTPGPGVWQPSGTNNDMLAAWLGSLRHLLVHPDPVSGPYPLGSAAWAADYNEVKLLGSSVQGARTDGQTATASFHNATHAGIAMGNAVIEHLTAHPQGILATAHLFAAMHVAAADALIYTWQQKRDVGFWRPFQAISGQYDDGNAATEPQPGWAPMIGNPNYSDYLSGHGCLTAPQVEVVRQVLGENTPLTLRTPPAVGTSRSYSALSEIEHEALHARIWGGLHYRKAMVDTYEMGHRTAVRVLGELA